MKELVSHGAPRAIGGDEVFRFADFGCWDFGFSCKLAPTISLESEVVIPSASAIERRVAMRPNERRETGDQDLFPLTLDQIIDKDLASVLQQGRKSVNIRASLG